MSTPACWQQKNVPLRLMSSTLSYFSSGNSFDGQRICMPAQLTSTSRRPKRSFTFAKASIIAGTLDTSSWTGMVSTPYLSAMALADSTTFSALMSASTIWLPSAANFSAML